MVPGLLFPPAGQRETRVAQPFNQKWEIPRLCRGDSNSLTFAGVHLGHSGREPPSPRRAERDSGSAILVGYAMADRPAGIRPTPWGRFSTAWAENSVFVFDRGTGAGAAFPVTRLFAPRSRTGPGSASHQAASPACAPCATHGSVGRRRRRRARTAPRCRSRPACR
jgi:hypothetical protein